jgi:hypothetical protein
MCSSGKPNSGAESTCLNCRYIVIGQLLTPRPLFLITTFLLFCGWSARGGSNADLRAVDLAGWPCLDAPTGSAKTQEGMERNQMKNRPPVDLAAVNIETLDTASFLKKVREYDSHLDAQRRSDLSDAEKALLNGYENQIVSLTGWLVLAYPGPPETTNCGDRNFHDWHLEIFESSSDHHPQIGDPTPIICEITPRTEKAIYDDNIRLHSISAFFRTGKQYESTGHPSRKIRVTGYLTWDDDHNGKADVGSIVDNISPGNGYHHPWRSTAWEIHPVIKIEILDSNATSEAPPVPTPRTITRQPATVANTPQFITITRPVVIAIPYGETTLQAGQRLEVVGRSGDKIRVKYLDRIYDIPTAAVQ